MATTPSPDSFLPLKPVDYQILFVLFRRELHGYAAVKAIAERTDGRVQLEPSNLYRRVRRLMKDGLVEESEARPTPELDDERRRYFTLTPLGRAALAADARRMRDLVLEAEAASILVAS